MKNKMSAKSFGSYNFLYGKELNQNTINALSRCYQITFWQLSETPWSETLTKTLLRYFGKNYLNGVLVHFVHGRVI